ncbi:DUF6082 family protein [Streptomyces sp. NPDC048491]|uniref:DUF6082 family protein n=1 Tax=Streptomyces sp. NPDC048491 TaxID=3157207 RepID=UPI0034474405
MPHRPLATPVSLTIAVFGTAHLLLADRHHRQRQELLAMQVHNDLLADVIRDPETDPAWSSQYEPWVKPGEDAKFFTLNRWLEWYRRGHLARVISTSDLQVNLTTFMKLDGGTLMWALTREKRWQQSAPHRLRRRFFRRVDTAFRKAGGEITHADLIREQRAAADRPQTMPPSAQDG